MTEILKSIQNIKEDNLTQTKTLFIGVIALFLLFVFVDSFISNFLHDIKIRGFSYLFFLLAWIFYWFFNKFFLPRNKKGKIGLVIAIYSENERERQKIKEDFIFKLKDDLEKQGISDLFKIIFFKNHFSKEIMDSSNSRKHLENVNKKIKAHFYIHGNIKKRNDGEEGKKYFINFHGYVVHKPIPQGVSNSISADFAKVLPNSLNFLEKRSFKGFEASAGFVHLAVRYIVGLAAFVSGDPQLALNLHDGLKHKFDFLKPLTKNLKDIRSRIPLLISDESLWVSKWHFFHNRLSETRFFLEKSLIENDNNYGAWLFKSFIDFQVDKDIDESVKSIKRAKRYSSSSFEWRYNMAFLYFWKEDYENALRMCRKIKDQSYLNESNTLKEVRKFTLNLIHNYPEKSQLYFWVGFLSYFKDSNIVNALQDFENFDKFTDKDILLKKESSRYLKEIKKEMNIK